jgi:hypothetical protein
MSDYTKEELAFLTLIGQIATNAASSASDNKPATNTQKVEE